MSKKQPQPLIPLLTRWGKALDRQSPLGEYPRPQMRRGDWVCLNGVWDYAIVDGAADTPPDVWDGEIVVPFSPESLLSGVSRQLLPGQTLFYRRAFALQQQPGKRLLLHFGAVDQRCAVYCNGKLAGEHSGGYWSFYFDITDCIGADGFELVVAVTDDSDTGAEAYGKQNLARGGIWYTPQSGIWQTVWAEFVPERHITSYRATPLYDQAAVEIEVALNETGAAPVEVEVLNGDAVVAVGAAAGGRLTLALPDFRSWSPDDPFLYGLRLTAGGDQVTGYFGMRKFEIVKDKAGRPRPALNGRPLFYTGLLDQGYWSDGMYTPPADAAMVFEIETLKSMGFNTLRKHIKIAPLRWYYHCDRLGMLVWQDFVSGGGPYNPLVTQALPFIGVRLKDKNYKRFGRANAAGRENYERDMRRTVALLYNCVGLAVWVPFNEGWGQFDSARVTVALRNLDPTRSIDHASGWHDQGAGDFCSRHVYYKKYRMRRDKRGRIQALSEFGGYSSPSPGHMAAGRLFGYKMYPSGEPLNAAVEALYRREVLPPVQKGLSAAIYTQVSDVEDEINGVFSYDREITKLDAARFRAINAELQRLLDSCF